MNDPETPAGTPPETDGVTTALDDADAALVSALESWTSGGEMTRTEAAEAAGIPVAALEAIEREGLLTPSAGGAYTDGDVEALRAGATLLASGLPLGEMLDLARRADEALASVAEHAVDRFAAFVRDPVKASGDDDPEAAQRLVAAFRQMLPATGTLVGQHFQRLLVAAARARAAGQRPPGS